MKKIISILVILLTVTGCFNTENFNAKNTYTTIYPIEYATKVIYGEYSNISSVYPSGINIKEYTITEKQKNKYALGETFIYNGLGNEAPIARDLLNINSNIKIIDAMKGMSFLYNVEELWLDPSNYLMISRNIKESLIDYNDNIYTKEEIEEKYKVLKEEISEIDVELYNIGKNKNYPSLLVSSNVFTYLTKYNINVISLDTKNVSLDKAYSDAKKSIENKTVKYIYVLKDEELNSTVTKLIQDYSLEKLEVNSLTTINDEQRKNGATYITIMKEILDQFKKELYR